MTILSKFGSRVPVAQLEPNFDGIVIGWSFSKIVFGSHALPSRWPPQCSCVVIESSFDTVERLQAPGASQRAGPPDTFLEEDHPMTILSKFGSRQEDLYVNFP
jgi:hypothetical protein